ncbi:GAF domain-like protein [Clavulina sp. PMI_390]|nr:GAF domain-like protein [Clavulina sp. PMI_390]
MPHADSSLVPDSITTKKEFWSHVEFQLKYLLEGQRNWVTNLSNASSLIYNSLLAFPSHFGPGEKAVNWSGFYLDSQLFPGKPRDPSLPPVLLLGPFNGKPACQLIKVKSGKGVCADAYVSRKTLVVPEVDKYPGHIACDGETKSEIVLPLLLNRADGEQTALGVLDLDCLALEGFDEDDAEGLAKITELVVASCDWD